MNKLWQEYPQIVEDLEIIKNRVSKVNQSSGQFLNESIDYLMATGGKMLRPAFALIGFGFGDSPDKDKVINIATAIETLHLATLIHDDVIDDSDLRRGKKTIQSKYNKNYAVYMGDYLFTQCFMMLSQYDYTKENLMNISKGISKICIGEMRQNKNRYNAKVSTGDYIRIISGKTAGLIGLSLAIGADLGDVKEKDKQKLWKIGYSIGMAFQIKDDLLDYQGDVKSVGKDVSMDLFNGYYTLPAIFAMKENSKILEPFLKDKSLLKPNINMVLDLIKASGGIKKTEKLCEKYTQRAITLTKELPDCESKVILLAIIKTLLNRDR